jgi:hypothetical protein
MMHFTKHALEKFGFLERHGVVLSKEQVTNTVKSPDLLDRTSRYPLVIAQTDLDKTHVLRVIYSQEDEQIIIITFYPGRKKQYGK